MKSSLSPIIIIIAVVVISAIGGAFFTVPQTHQAIVLRFGELTNTHTEPGLKFKVPFIDKAIMYEKRVLDYDLPPVPVTTAGRKRVIGDVYCRYIIEDATLFFKTIKPSNETGARMRLEALVSSAVRNVIGQVKLRDLLSEKRVEIMSRIEAVVRKLSKPLGISIIEIRMIRAELPHENRQAVYKRMIAGLSRQAKENRAKGAEEAQSVRSKAERNRTVMVAEAQKNAQIVRAQGKAKAITIAGKSLSKAPKLYEAIESWRIYQDNLGGSEMVLSADNDLFKYFVQPRR